MSAASSKGTVMRDGDNELAILFIVITVLTCKYNKPKSLNYRNFSKPFPCNIQSLETWNLRDRDQDSQKWVSRWVLRPSLETLSLLFILASIWFSAVKWSKEKVLTGGNLSWGYLALRWVNWLICCNENTVLWLTIRTIKHDAKKYFLVVKMTLSICMNRKLLRMKLTTKQENNRT